MAGTFTDLSVCRNAEDLTCTAGCDSSSSGNVTDEFTGDKVTNDSAVAAGTVVDQSDGFNTFVNRNTVRLLSTAKKLLLPNVKKLPA